MHLTLWFVCRKSKRMVPDGSSFSLTQIKKYSGLNSFVIMFEDLYWQAKHVTSNHAWLLAHHFAFQTYPTHRFAFSFGPQNMWNRFTWLFYQQWNGQSNTFRAIQWPSSNWNRLCLFSCHSSQGNIRSVRETHCTSPTLQIKIQIQEKMQVYFHKCTKLLRFLKYFTYIPFLNYLDVIKHGTHILPGEFSA